MVALCGFHLGPNLFDITYSLLLKYLSISSFHSMFMYNCISKCFVCSCSCVCVCVSYYLFGWLESILFLFYFFLGSRCCRRQHNLRRCVYRSRWKYLHRIEKTRRVCYKGRERERAWGRDTEKKKFWSTWKTNCVQIIYTLYERKENKQFNRSIFLGRCFFDETKLLFLPVATVHKSSHTHTVHTTEAHTHGFTTKQTNKITPS